MSRVAFPAAAAAAALCLLLACGAAAAGDGEPAATAAAVQAVPHHQDRAHLARLLAGTGKTDPEVPL